MGYHIQKPVSLGKNEQNGVPINQQLYLQIFTKA